MWHSARARRFPILSFFVSLAVLGGCSSSDDDPGPIVPPPPPPPADMSAAGIWDGTASTPDTADVTTSFEFDDSDGFTVGTAPFSADFQGGITETRGVGALYQDGAFSWHVDTAGGSITFNAPLDELTFYARTVTGGDTATISVRDTDDVEIISIAVPDAFQEFVIARDVEGGESPIGSVVITVTNGEIVVDLLTFGFPSTASDFEIGCIVLPDGDFGCALSDAVSGEFIATAGGMFSISGDQVSGSGWLYAPPGGDIRFPDGSTLIELSVTSGTVAEGATLDVVLEGITIPITIGLAFETAESDRGADLATVMGSYTSFDIFGDPSSFDVDAAGVISGTSAAGCLLSGQISVPDAAINAYDVAITITDSGGGTCAVADGDYNGLGATGDENAVDDSFVFAVFIDGVAAIIGQAVK